jgi:hypothetical protein
MEQLVRDGRISTVYEGTTGIQALDLIGRKVLATGGQLQRNASALIREFCDRHAGDTTLREYVSPLSDATDRWDELTTTISEKAIENLDELGAASVDYLLFAGYVVLAYMWARMAAVANEKLAADTCAANERAFYGAKRLTASFYFARILPRTGAHAAAALAGAETVMSIDEADFVF